jgi:hypothetical protein
MSGKDMRGQGKYRFVPGRKVWGRSNKVYPERI